MSSVDVTKNGSSSVDRDDYFWPHLFDPFRSLGSSVAHFFSPKSEARQAKQKYTVSVELPGVKQNDIDISLNDHVLTVMGEKHASREERGEDNRTYFCERTFGSFQRSFRLPADVSADDIEAAFSEGVLTITIPKVSEELAKPKKINVKAA